MLSYLYTNKDKFITSVTRFTQIKASVYTCIKIKSTIFLGKKYCSATDSCIIIKTRIKNEAKRVI